MNLLYPRIHLRHWPAMLAHAAPGAVFAAVYGIVHDQITFGISPEYFTRFKFVQFHYADLGLPQRLFVAEIGILAGEWAGLVAGWFIARQTVPFFPPAAAPGKSLRGFAIIFVISLLASGAGCILGRLRGLETDYAGWQHFASLYSILDLPAFVRVAYIHNASYLGGGIGLIAAILWLRRIDPAPVRDGQPRGKPQSAPRAAENKPFARKRSDDAHFIQRDFSMGLRIARDVSV